MFVEPVVTFNLKVNVPVEIPSVLGSLGSVKRYDVSVAALTTDRETGDAVPAVRNKR
jgi:hypothetical protein